MNATKLLEQAAYAIGNRASERDVEQERSMKATVEAFNSIYGTQLTEEQGWGFMILLKMVRTKGAVVQADNYLDGAAYFALMGEAALQARKLSDRVCTEEPSK